MPPNSEEESQQEPSISVEQHIKHSQDVTMIDYQQQTTNIQTEGGDHIEGSQQKTVIEEQIIITGEKQRKWTAPVIIGLVLAALFGVLSVLQQGQQGSILEGLGLAPGPTATPLAAPTAVTEGDDREVLVLIAAFE